MTPTVVLRRPPHAAIKLAACKTLGKPQLCVIERCTWLKLTSRLCSITPSDTSSMKLHLWLPAVAASAQHRHAIEQSHNKEPH